MPADALVLRAARNAFFVLIVAFLGVGIYQAVTQGSVRTEVWVLWLVGVAVFYGSKWYYGRGEAAGDGTSAAGDGN